MNWKFFTRSKKNFMPDTFFATFATRQKMRLSSYGLVESSKIECVRKQRTLPSGGSSQQVIAAKGKYYPAITDPLMEAIGRDKSYLSILSIVLVGVDFAHGIFGSSSKLIGAIGGIGMFIMSLSLPVSILVGFVGRSTLINGCMNCGFKWTPAKRK